MADRGCRVSVRRSVHDDENTPGREGRTGRGRHPGRGPCHRRAAGRRGRDRLRDRKDHPRAGQRARPGDGDHRGDGGTGHGRGRRRHRRTDGPSGARAGPGAGRADRAGPRPARHPGQRHLGRQLPARLQHEDVGRRAGARAADARSRSQEPHHHQQHRASPAGEAARRSGRRGHRRHGRHQQGFPRELLLRPRQERPDPHGLHPGRGAEERGRQRRGGHPGLHPLRGDARHLRTHRGDLARRDRQAAALGAVRVAGLSRPGSRRARRRSGARTLERTVLVQRRAGQGVRSHRRGRQCGRMSGRT